MEASIIISPLALANLLNTNNGTEQIFLPNVAPSQSSAPTQRLGANAPPPSTQVNLDNVQDFSHVCRICATITELVMPIFSGEGLQNKLASKIKKHLPITVRERDELPLVVCYQCANTLLAWHELVKCCVQADLALHAKLSANKRKTNPPNNVIVTSSASVQNEPQGKSPCDSPEEPRSALSDRSELSDDEPLATFATRKPTNLYTNFFNALVNFRDHFVNDQHHEEYPDLTDSSVSDAEVDDVDRFDDLTQCNMRRDRLDEETRLELREVQNKIDNKTYYTCKICNKNLSSAHTYLFHKRIHTGERPCVCHVCGKQFRAPNGLQRHLTETHERLRRYNCSLCTKTFANSQNLKQHIRIHTGEKPFVCSHCGKRFTQSGSLHVHLKTHSEQFPYECAECGAKFRLRSGLVRHRLKHTGERPHLCATCGAGFRQRHELRAHAAAHCGAAPHCCAACPRAFRQRRALRHHVRRVHPPHPPDLPYAHGAHVAPYYYIPEMSPPQQVRACAYCARAPPAARCRQHLAERHSQLLFLCEKCDNLVDRKDFIPHLSLHARQYDTEKSVRKLIYRRKKAQNNNQAPAPTPAPTNIVPKCSPKSPSPKLIIKIEERNTPVPVKIDTPTLAKIDTPVPGKIDTPVAAKIDDQTPFKINTPIPAKKDTPVPVNIDNPVPFKKDIPVPVNVDTPVPLKIDATGPVKIDTPVPGKTNKTSVQENDFSDHSDTEGFGPLPESVFEAIEDSQDGQQLTQPAGTTSHAPDTEPSKVESIKSDAPQNNILTNPTICLENNNNMNNCSVVIEPMKIESCAHLNMAIRNRSVINIPVPPENNALPKTAEVNNKQSTVENGKKNQKKTRKCPYCPKEYRASSSYFYHLKYSHEGSEEHECEVCGKKLRSKSSLTQHMAVHTAYYGYECSQCEKRFKSKAGLYIHEQTHKSTKSYSCKQCDTSFRWKTHLARHSARHAAERAHACGACGRAFAVRADLLRHARTHAAHTLSCDKCGQKFAQLRYLKVHAMKQHARHSKRLAK